MDGESDALGLVILIVNVCIAFAVGQGIGRSAFRDVRGSRLWLNALGIGLVGSIFISLPFFVLLGTDHPLWPYAMLGNGIAAALGVTMRKMNEEA